MSDGEYHRPTYDPSVGQMPNGSDIFWWEFKASSYSAAISSHSQWSEFSNTFKYSRLVVSLETCEFPVDEAVYNIFNNKAILEGGSWARMNATLRQLFRSSISEEDQAEIQWPMAVKLGRDSSFQSLSSFVT